MMTSKPRPTIVHGETHAYPVLPLRDIVVFPHNIVPLFVGRMMMLTMPGGPDGGRLLHAARAQNGQRALQPSWAGKAAMRQKPMVPDIHAEPAEDVASQQRKHDPGPAEEPGQACKERDNMDKNDRRRVSPFDPP